MLRGALGVVLLVEERGDLGFVQHRREAVGAEQQAVAGLELDRVEVDLHARLEPERAVIIDRRGSRSASSSVSSPGRHQLLDEAVVGRDAGQLAVAQQVRARVADVADGQRAVDVEDAGGERGAHPTEALVGRRALEHRVVGNADRIGDVAGAGERGAQRLERGGARHLAAAVTAHAVGDGDEPEVVVDEVAVLVVVAHLADVGGRAHDDAERHRWTSPTVSPNCTRSPRFKRVGACTGWPFTNVPLRDPRSST